MALPYLTPAFPGIGGTIKNRPEDFFVQEVPLYEPAGEGEHVYFEIQKVGVPTFDAVDRIARALRVSAREVGYAGLKDARAVTRQVLSIAGVTEDAVMGLSVPGVTVLWAARHGNKLRLGHLAGNRFAIKIRGVTPTDVVKLDPVMAELERRGMPNYFGEQRFGRRGDNDRLGAALVAGDDLGVLKLLLGTPVARMDDGQTHQARALFDKGDYEAAMKAMPRRHGMERRVLARFIKTGRADAAVRTIDDRIRRLWVSALQSRLFNEVLAARAGTIDKLVDGDLAWKHDSGAVFAVTDAAAEQPRCDAFEVSPSGPLVGYRMTMPAGEALRAEEESFAARGLKPDDFRRTGDLKVKGARRPLRVKPTDCKLEAGVDGFGPYVTAAFTLPPGSFATVLMRELMKNEAAETGVGTDAAE
ncbi:MAG: truD [Phycisphaerales bacterium]|nr:truD [Phycisphaerales bacterium]